MPFAAESALASVCRADVLAFLDIAPRVNPRFPFAVSLLYASGPVPTLDCNVDEKKTGFETATAERQLAAQRMFDDRFGPQPSWAQVYNAEYPVNALRSVSRNMVRAKFVRVHAASLRVLGSGGDRLICDQPRSSQSPCGAAQVHLSRHIFLSEPDFMGPVNLHRTLSTGIGGALLDDMRASWARRGERKAMIVPAFERLGAVEADGHAGRRCARAGSEIWPGTSCLLYESLDVPLTKPALQRMLAQGRASVFHERSVRAHQRSPRPHVSRLYQGAAHAAQRS